jgi:hypothetical protein
MFPSPLPEPELPSLLLPPSVSTGVTGLLPLPPPLLRLLPLPSPLLLLLSTVLLPSMVSTLASVALASLTLVASTSLALVVSPPLPLQPLLLLQLLLLLLLLLLLQPVATEYIQLVAIQIVDKPLYFLARRMCDELHSTTQAINFSFGKVLT